MRETTHRDGVEAQRKQGSAPAAGFLQGGSPGGVDVPKSNPRGKQILELQKVVGNRITNRLLRESGDLTGRGGTGSEPRVDVGIVAAYDGERIYVPRDTSSMTPLAHELAHAALDHGRPTSSPQGSPPLLGGGHLHVDPAQEGEAQALAKRIEPKLDKVGPALIRHAEPASPAPISGRPLVPLLVDGFGQPLSAGAIKRLLDLFRYRHGPEETGVVKRAIELEQTSTVGIKLKEFTEELKDPHSKLSQALDDGSDEELLGTFKGNTRTGLLLELVLNEYQDEFETERIGKTGAEAWADVAKAKKLIDGNAALLNLLGNASKVTKSDQQKIESLEGQLSQLAGIIAEDQWQAAAVASLRGQVLNGAGFRQLRASLSKASNQTIQLRMDGAVLSEGAISASSDIVSTGVFSTEKVGSSSVKPVYPINMTEKTLNSAIAFFSSSGWYYKSKFGLLLKSLDVGHKAVDQWEDIAHRTDEQISPKTDFKYLALLSPKMKQPEQLIGANGMVLGDGSYMFIIDTGFHLRYMPAANYIGEGGKAKNFVQFIPHAQLAAKNLVLAAGNFVIKDGTLDWIDNGSGHYRVNAQVNEANTRATLQSLGYPMDTTDPMGHRVRFLDRGAGQLDDLYVGGNYFLPRFPDDKRPAMTPEIRAMQTAMDQMI